MLRLQLEHARRAEQGRAQRWMCSWLYKLRACDDAERAQRVPQMGATPANGQPGQKDVITDEELEEGRKRRKGSGGDAGAATFCVYPW